MIQADTRIYFDRSDAWRSRLLPVTDALAERTASDVFRPLETKPLVVVAEREGRLWIGPC
jgi:hypothetical protein